MSTSPSDLTLEETRAALYRKEISPREVAAGYLEAINRWEPALGAFVSLSEDRVLNVSRIVTDEFGRGVFRPLAGIGVSVKDNIDVAGLQTTAGSSWLNEQATDDAECWRRVELSGAVHIGKTNMHEFAYGATNVNHKAQTTRNPWDRRHISGGSSGGSAVSVAIGSCGASLGTDTGGSVRIPAALTGVTGFKPTLGRIPTAGVFPLSPACDTVGVISRTAAGCARVFRSLVLHGELEHDDPWRLSLRGAHLGVVMSHVSRSSPAVSDAFRRALDAVEALGATVEPFELPHEEDARLSTGTIVQFEAAQVHRRWLHDRGEDYGDDVRARLETGLTVSGRRYRAAKDDRSELAAKMLESQSRFDAVIGPTVPITAPRVEACGLAQAAGMQAALLANTYCFNVTGQPAISVPCGMASDGLPVGLQIAAAPGRDWDVLRIARALQRTTEWHRRRPSLEGLRR
ncbi:amidase [Nonomuraea sp. B1E8]|uniref:amidase n=1 Tax=unclassified Nonomuraea TaxID=2593643 RepID=UPI00325F8100